MIIQPMVRNGVCMSAHPVGCAKIVDEYIAYTRSLGSVSGGPKNVLVLGCSTGFGLSSRITAAFGSGANTIGVSFEKPASDKRTGTPGFYNNRAFDLRAREAGLTSITIEGDAFSNEIKQQVIAEARKLSGPIDLVIYSLASGIRTDPDTGITYRSALKPVGKTYIGKTIDVMSGKITELAAEPASEEEIESTVRVMGGYDWELWVKALKVAGVLAHGVQTVAYSYIGPELTREIYREGTIGRAKQHIEGTAASLTKELSSIGGSAYISVNKALVTRASAVIPAMPMYISALFKVMKAKGTHEGCIEQINRLFRERLYTGKPMVTDQDGRIRIDDWEMEPDVQRDVTNLMKQITEENLAELTDFAGYQADFLEAHGFGVPGIDYGADVDPN